MNWIPLYIVGKDGFQPEVMNALKHSSIPYMPGYLQDDLQPGEHQVYWIDEKAELRSVKKAISAKVIFKYRLRVFTEMNEFLQEHEYEEETKLSAVDFKVN